MVYINFTRKIQYMGIFSFFFFFLLVQSCLHPGCCHRTVLINIIENAMTWMWMRSNVRKTTSSTVKKC